MFSEVHFSGPDSTPGLLRDVLAERIASVPAGGAIDWITYYFRDRRLAVDLVEAQRRGADVRVTLDGYPRTCTANEPVIAILRQGLGSRLRVVRSSLDSSGVGLVLRARVHEKLYCFSHPEPTAMLGSFNPSGDEPEQAPEMIDEIGDHNRGYNDLVEIRDPELVPQLVAHARRINATPRGFTERFSPAANRALTGNGMMVHFWPRVGRNPVDRWLGQLGSGSRVRLAVSHLSGRGAPRTLLRLAKRGVSLEILTEATLRRVPQAVEQRLLEAGIRIRRVVHSHSEWLPMHSKFLLVEAPDERAVVFGSLNWSDQSRLMNREVAVIARDAGLFEAFASRWDILQKYAD
jgi:phosphatidylserine/phosphatidylglycerophosphate/cardiolipin synthase-like enzyme